MNNPSPDDAAPQDQTSSPVEPTQNDLAMMHRALVLAAQAAAQGEVPVGAVVYETNTGRVLAEAFNTRHRTKDPTAHAELIAVQQAARVLGDWRLNDCTVVVTLEPCAMCAGVMVNARVGRLVYGTADPKAGACESLYRIPQDSRLNHCCEIIAGVRAQESRDLLKAFFQARRHTPAIEKDSPLLKKAETESQDKDMTGA